ncbi:MAG: ribbon-helix-helix protein, CopG family [Bacteroidales bacterium]|nr:ribbon-helix-helix protein, CopG family [Bacteroidales bacterium]
MTKKAKMTGVDPEFLEKQRLSLLRRNRQTIYLNDQEVAAIQEYCRRFGVKHRSALLRDAIMEQILSELGENHPTLF